MFFKTSVLINFSIFARKHLCWSLFLISLAACKIFKNIFPCRTPPMAGSGTHYLHQNIPWTGLFNSTSYNAEFPKITQFFFFDKKTLNFSIWSVFKENKDRINQKIYLKKVLWAWSGFWETSVTSELLSYNFCSKSSTDSVSDTLIYILFMYKDILFVIYLFCGRLNRKTSLLKMMVLSTASVQQFVRIWFFAVVFRTIQVGLCCNYNISVS